MKPKKLLALVLSLAMIIGALPTFSLTASADTTTEKNITLGTSALKGGQASNVYFGTYQQSSLGNTEPTDGINGVDWIKSDTAIYNGQGAYYSKDPIKWRVLSNDGSKLFLLSDKNLDVVHYHEDYEAVTWETSTIRSWLNGYGAALNQNNVDYSNDNFINAAFSAAEKGVIADTTVKNDDNPTYETEGGIDTTDKVFLLSFAEAQNTAYGFTNNTSSTDTRKAVNTAYVYGGGKNGSDSMEKYGDADFWWLRSPGKTTDFATSVTLYGFVSSIGNHVHIDNPVRPAFHLTLSSVLFTSAAEGGKPMGTGLSATTAYTGNEYKLTLADSSRSSFTASVSDVLENHLIISYTNAVADTNEYISAIIESADGNVTHYGRLANVTSESGTASLDMTGITLASTDKLYIFNEQYNGDYMTDYASPLNEIEINLYDVTFDDILSAEWFESGTYQVGEGEAAALSSEGVTVADGQSLTLTLTAKAGYTVKSVTYNNAEYPVTNGVVTITPSVSGAVTATAEEKQPQKPYFETVTNYVNIGTYQNKPSFVTYAKINPGYGYDDKVSEFGFTMKTAGGQEIPMKTKEAAFPSVLQYGIRAFGDLESGETYEMIPYLIVEEEKVTGTTIPVKME